MSFSLNDAKSQLGNVLTVLPSKLSRFEVADDYDFNSEVPLQENLFAISSAGLSYVSIKDDADNLIWQSVGGGGGGGFSEDSPKGGPIFVTGLYSSAGAVSMEGDLQYGAVWTGASTPEDSVTVNLLVERGDSQNYKPTGVYYYQTGQASETPNEAAPVYISADNLTLDQNDYSWKTEVDISTLDSLMYDDGDSLSTYYLFFNGERSTEISIKRSALPEVEDAIFEIQDGSYGDCGSGNEYPFMGSHLGGFITPGNTTGFDMHTQTAVKNGDEVLIKVTSDKPLSSVIFKNDAGIIRSLESLEATWYGPSVDNGGSWDTHFLVNITNADAIASDQTFQIKIKDLQGNVSEDWFESTNGLNTDNTSPSFSVGNPAYSHGGLAIGPGDGVAEYNVAGNFGGTDYFQFDLQYSDIVLDVSHAWDDSNLLNDGQKIKVKASSGPSSAEQTLSPFSLKVLRSTNGAFVEYNSVPSLIVQDGNDPVLTLNVDAVRSGPGDGHEDEIIVTSNVSLSSLDLFADQDPFGDGTVITSPGASSAVQVDAKNWKIKVKSLDSAARETPFDIILTTTKYSSQGSPITVSSQVRGFVQREISKNGVEALSEIPIGTVVVNPAKIKSKSGLMENLTLKVNSGNEANVPFNSEVSSSSLGGGVGAEFGLSADSSSIILDSDARAQWSPQDSTTVYITLEELI